MVIELVNFSRCASPFASFPRPVRVDNRLVPVGQLVLHAGVTIQHEAGAIEHNLVLPANPVQKQHRNPGFAHPLGSDLAQALVVLLNLIGAAVYRNEQFRAARLQMFADGREPDILTDWQTDFAALEHDRLGHRAGREQPLFIKCAVIGQFDLVADILDMSALEQRNAIIELVIFAKHRPDQHRRPRSCGSSSQPVQLRLSALPQRWLQHQILRRIADQLQFGEHDQIAVRSRPVGCNHRIGIAAQIAHALGQLRHGDDKLVRHRALIERATVRSNRNKRKYGLLLSRPSV